MQVSSLSVNVDLRYKRLGHPAGHALKCVLKSCNPSADVNEIHKLSFCNACQYGKNIFNILILLIPKLLNHYNFFI